MQAYDRGDYAIPDERVAEAFNRITEPLFNRIVANIHENRTLAELRNALLPKLMSGEIRVREGEKKVERIVGRCV